MSPWIVPILAQALSLSVGDRTEARLRVETNDRVPEAETRPYADLRWSGRRSALSFGYSPLFVLSPLDEKKPELYVLHTARIGFDFRQRRTAYQITQTASYGRQNFASTALSGTPGLPAGTFPATPGTGPGGTVTTPTGTPGTTTGNGTPLGPGTTTGPGAVPGTATGTPIGATNPNSAAVRDALTVAVLRTDFTATHALTRTSSFTFGAGYFVIGGVGDSRRELPLQSGPDLRLRYDLRLTAKDQLFTATTGTYSSVSNGTRLWRLSLEQGYAHQFSESILVRLSAGVSYVRERRDGVWTDTIYPTFGSNALVGVSYTTRFAGGQLTASAGVGYSPALTYTPTTKNIDVRIDPRFLMFGGLGWVKHRTTLFLNAGATLSLTPSEPGSVSNYTGAAGMYYTIVDGLVFEAGLRGLRQTVANGPDISFAYALYAALRYDTTLF
ncbi:MAG TPA: hypothetical protein VFQ61_27610 [Polyangiaceae bacterium]|nr:hypothetical protein [Polyangiaceae bacterium]